MASCFNLSFSEHKLITWADVENRKSLFRRRIGFTKQNLEQLSRGHEVKVWVDYPGLHQDKYYVFIHGLEVIDIKDGARTELYYLYSKDVVKQLENIYRLLAERHPGYRNIGIGWLFYDEIIDFKRESKNHKDFESKLFRSIRFDLVTGGKFVEKTEQKGPKDYGSFGRSRYPETQYSEYYVSSFDPELEELASRYDAMEQGEEHFLDDLRADFYSDF